MIETEIVDAHHHLWDLSSSYPWLQEAAGQLQVHGDDTGIRRNYLVPDLRADAAGLRLVASVHVDAGAADPWAESRWLQGVADAEGLPTAIVAGTKLAAPDAAEQLERQASLSRVRGVRDVLNWHPDPSLTYIDRADLMTDPAWLRGFRRLEPLGLSFDLQLYPAQLAQAARLAADHPGTLILLNHAAMPVDRSAEGLRVWRAGLRALAAQDNVLVKISGIGMTDHHWTLDSLAPIVLECVEAFGPARAMFGSNFPVDRIYSGYAELYAAFDRITAEFAADERRQLFGAVARLAYRI